MTTVIVIDDDPDSVTSLSDLLEENGIKVVGKGANGKEAVFLFNQNSPDYSIIDMRMPQFDGKYAIEQIKKQDPSAKIIAITAYPFNEIQTNDVLGIVRKPYKISEILELMGVRK